METNNFISSVKKMRYAQLTYAETHSQKDFSIMRRLERQVDQEIEQWEKQGEEK